MVPGPDLYSLQELEHKVHELEMQLQLRELVKAHTLIEQAKQEVATRPHHEAQSEEAQKAFAARLAEARRKTEQLSAKRNQEEAHILRYVFTINLPSHFTHPLYYPGPGT